MVEMGLGEEKSRLVIRDPVTTISSTSALSSVTWAPAGAVSTMSAPENATKATLVLTRGGFVALVAMSVTASYMGKGRPIFVRIGYPFVDYCKRHYQAKKGAK